MKTHQLVAHPDYPPPPGVAVTVGLAWKGPHWLALRWRVDGADEVHVPPFSGRIRRDGLWQTTCFELFCRRGQGGAYDEWNFSPSQAWAAYSFSGYRAGMQPAATPRAPVIDWRGGHSRLALLDVALPAAALPPFPAAIGVSAVLEHLDGSRSFWALAHAAGQADFHADACFAGRLDAAPPP